MLRVLATIGRSATRPQMTTMAGLVPLPDVQELRPSVIRVLGQNPGLMTLQGTNCYLIHPPRDYSTFTLIDTGSPAPLADIFVPKLLDAMRTVSSGSRTIGKAAITDIILTHYHADHIGGLPTLLDALRESQPGCAPRIHKYPIPRSSSLGLKDEELVEAISEDSVRRNSHGETIHWLKDGQVIRLGADSTRTHDELELQVMHTPGHTPDSISLLLRPSSSPLSLLNPTTTSDSPASTSSDTILFSGDTILGQSTTIFTDLSAYLSALRRLRALQPDTIFPGHGPAIQGPKACVEKIDGYIEHRMNRETQIMEIMRRETPVSFQAEGGSSTSPAQESGLTTRQIVQRLYTGPNEGERVWRAAEHPVKAHLEKLESDGRVRRVLVDSSGGDADVEVTLKQSGSGDEGDEVKWILSDTTPSSSRPHPLIAPRPTSSSEPPTYGGPSSGGLRDSFTLDTVFRLMGKTIFSPVVAGVIPVAVRANGVDKTLGMRVAVGWAGVVLASRFLFHLGRIYNAQFSFLISPRKVVWSDQVVVITGGASGIGALLAEEIALRGGRVAVLDINPSTSTSARIISYEVDVSKFEAVQAAAKRIRDDVGSPTILVNNAGVVSGKLILDLEERDVRRTFDVNVLSHFWTLKAFLPEMIERKLGHVVTVGSVLGIVGSAQMIDYCASKAALLNLHESLRFELKNRYHAPAIRTTLVLPGHVNTSLFSSLRLPTSPFFRFLAPTLTPSDVVEAILSALENQESRVIRLPVYTNVARLMGVGAGLVPVWMKDLAQWFSGADTAMEAYGPT